MRGTGHAEGVADDEGAPGDGGLEHGRHRPYTLADDAALLGLEPDQETRAVAEIDHRQVEGLREIDEARHLLAGIGCPAATIEHRIARHDGDRPAIDAGKTGDDRAAIEL